MCVSHIRNKGAAKQKYNAGFYIYLASQVALVVKNLPVMQKTQEMWV